MKSRKDVNVLVETYLTSLISTPEFDNQSVRQEELS